MGAWRQNRQAVLRVDEYTRSGRNQEKTVSGYADCHSRRAGKTRP